jgi:hypothetical protein
MEPALINEPQVRFWEMRMSIAIWIIFFECTRTYALCTNFSPSGIDTCSLKHVDLNGLFLSFHPIPAPPITPQNIMSISLSDWTFVRTLVGTSWAERTHIGLAFKSRGEAFQSGRYSKRWINNRRRADTGLPYPWEIGWVILRDNQTAIQDSCGKKINKPKSTKGRRERDQKWTSESKCTEQIERAGGPNDSMHWKNGWRSTIGISTKRTFISQTRWARVVTDIESHSTAETDPKKWKYVLPEEVTSFENWEIWSFFAEMIIPGRGRKVVISREWNNRFAS